MGGDLLDIFSALPRPAICREFVGKDDLRLAGREREGGPDVWGDVSMFTGGWSAEKSCIGLLKMEVKWCKYGRGNDCALVFWCVRFKSPSRPLDNEGLLQIRE